uniref:Uncharacterized protein n=1 Tax=Chromera velia CCMP2878 TaxID=1169474 RepID=A0A0G4I9T9_9ALVE|eukprot:Cvel_12245.t1-p1 / transcript=Cvel_12245.t1 / gene=Cvel_12245 / organism=Chromera_velia_CCMP2878 / gene_product=hypothetical protein / transcript_product=hypothetical protein / location=Cvel_scaffold793:17063-20697(-) / protein_length=925 / sequence_SO=supercontig / SO=protein_coding / is_pseudo=false
MLAPLQRAQQRATELPTSSVQTPQPPMTANRFDGLAVDEAEGPEEEKEEKEITEDLFIGRRVEIRGLKNKPELNGSVATVLNYVQESGRYSISCCGVTYAMKPDNLEVVVLSQDAERDQLTGATLAFRATCCLINIQDAFAKVKRAWDDFKAGSIPLLAATAETNACVRYITEIVATCTLEHPELSSLEALATAAFLSDIIEEIHRRNKPSLSFTGAFALVQDVAFGEAGNNLSFRLAIGQGSGTFRYVPAVPVHLALSGQGNIFDGQRCHESARADLQNFLDRSIEMVQRRAKCRGSAGAKDLLSLVSREVTERLSPFGKWEFRHVHADCKIAGGPVAAFLVGKDGLIHTSAFLRKEAACGNIKRPAEIPRQTKFSSKRPVLQWFVPPQPSNYGAPWDESKKPARSTEDLNEYLEACFPAWKFYAEQATDAFPDLPFEEDEPAPESSRRPESFSTLDCFNMKSLMPFFLILQEDMLRERLSVSLVAGVHCVLLSVLSVNGNNACTRLMVQAGTVFGRAEQQMSEAFKFFEEKNTATSTRIECAHKWLYAAVKRPSLGPNAWPSPWTPYTIGKDPEGGLQRVIMRQSTQAMLLNPWVVGQQILVVAVGLMLDLGCRALDCCVQLRVVVHLYNAMSKAGCMEENIPLLEMLMTATQKISRVWKAGVPTCKFLPGYYLALGARLDGSAGRLQALGAEKISPVFRRCALEDFCDLDFAYPADGTPGDPLETVLSEIRRSFETDKWVGSNLAALGIHLMTVQEEMVIKLGWSEKVLAMERQLLSHEVGSRRAQKVDEFTGPRVAVRAVLVPPLLLGCEPGLVERQQLAQVQGVGGAAGQAPPRADTKGSRRKKAGRKGGSGTVAQMLAERVSVAGEGNEEGDLVDAPEDFKQAARQAAGLMREFFERLEGQQAALRLAVPQFASLRNAI